MSQNPFEFNASGFTQPDTTFRFSITDVFGFGWKGFSRNAGVFVVGALLVLVLNLAASLVQSLFGLGASLSYTHINNIGLFQLTSVTGLLSMLVTCTVNTLIAIVIARISLKVASGQRLQMSDLVVFECFMHGFILTLAIELVSSALLPIWGSEWLIDLTVWFAILFIVGKRQNALAAAINSVKMFWNNLVTCLVFFVLCAVANVVGMLLFGIGLIITIPVTSLVCVWLFRKLQGEAALEEFSAN